MEEEWKDIKYYEGLYQISNTGRIKSFKRYLNGKILKSKKDKDGYLEIGIRDENGQRKFYRIHRLVAQAFISNPNNYSEINHIDCNPSNNNSNNLEWCTIEYNNKYKFTYGNGNNKGENGSCATLTNEQAKEIREKWNTGNYKINDLVKLYNSARGVIEGVVNNVTYVDSIYIKTYDGKINYTGINNSSAKLNEQKVKEIRDIYSSTKISYRKLGKMYGVCAKTIDDIIKFKKWKNA